MLYVFVLSFFNWAWFRAGGGSVFGSFIGAPCLTAIISSIKFPVLYRLSCIPFSCICSQTLPTIVVVVPAQPRSLHCPAVSVSQKKSLTNSLMSYLDREICRGRMHPRRSRVPGAARQHNGRPLRSQRSPSNHRGTEGKSEEVGIVEHVLAKEPLQGGCRVQQSGVWAHG
jgi:hypothetical protein